MPAARRLPRPAGIVTPVRIAVGSDHAGYGPKTRVVPLLEAGGHEVVDVGTRSGESTDSRISADRAARLVAHGEAEYGLLLCGSGAGVSIAANKVPGVRAVNARDAGEAEPGRRHNDANALALAGRRLGVYDAGEIERAFPTAGFEGGRRGRRVDQIAGIEGRTSGRG